MDAAIAKALDAAQVSSSLLICDTRALHAALDSLVGRKVVVRPVTSAYARADYWESLNPLERHLHIVRALAKRHPHWTFCTTSAAAVLGFSPSYRRLDRIHVIADPNDHQRREKLVRFHQFQEAESLVSDGIRVTSPERTVFDCTRSLPFAEGLAIADAATRACNWHDSHLAEYLAALDHKAHHRGIRRSRMVASYVDGRSESGGESIARASMIRMGIPLPELQVEIADPLESGHVFRVDYLWRLSGGTLVAGELDGQQKYADPSMLGDSDTIAALARERLRESRLSATGVRVARFSFSQASDPEELARILDAFGVKPGLAPSQPLQLPRDIERLGNVSLRDFGPAMVLASTFRLAIPANTGRALTPDIAGDSSR